jgi:peroxiredoxin
MIQTGSVAPDFDLAGADAGSIDRHSLADYVDRGWTTVLVFYPFDFHPGCVAQWCALRDTEWLTLVEDVVVLGVGSDSAYSHRAFAEEYDLQFPLLADYDGSVSAAYGALLAEFDGHPRVPGPAMVVVAPDRTVSYVWSGNDFANAPDPETLRTVVGDEEAPPGGEA